MTAVIAAFGAGVMAFAIYNPGRGGGFNTTANHFILPRLSQPGTVSLAELAGRPLVVEFFASGCSACASELDLIAADARARRGRVDVVAVEIFDDGNATAAEARPPLPFPVTAVARDVGGSDGDGLYETLGGTGTLLPLIAFYSAHGVLLRTEAGDIDARALSDDIARLLKATST